MTTENETVMPEKLKKNDSLLKMRVALFVSDVVRGLLQAIPNSSRIDTDGITTKVSVALYRVMRNELPMAKKLITAAEADKALEEKKSEVADAIELSISSMIIRALDPLLWNAPGELQAVHVSIREKGDCQAVFHAEINGTRRSFTRHLRVAGPSKLFPLGFTKESGLKLRDCGELVAWSVKRSGYKMPPALKQAIEGRLI